jgi:pyruvate carboxylase subunit B
MPGLVVKIEVEVGDEVRAGQGLVIVEAMKMENELKSEGAGRVAAIHAGVGDAVEKDQILVDLDSLEEVGSDG